MLQVKFTKTGLCHGFVLWIDWLMDLQNTVVVSTGPGMGLIPFLLKKQTVWCTLLAK